VNLAPVGSFEVISCRRVKVSVWAALIVAMDMAQIRRNPIFHMRVFPNETLYFVDGCDKLFAVTIVHCIQPANLVNRKQCCWTHPFGRLRQLPRRSLRPEFEARQHWIGNGVSCGECGQRQQRESVGRWERLLLTQKKGTKCRHSVRLSTGIGIAPTQRPQRARAAFAAE
jgi:hypothetical protein